MKNRKNDVGHHRLHQGYHDVPQKQIPGDLLEFSHQGGYVFLANGKDMQEQPGKVRAVQIKEKEAEHHEYHVDGKGPHILRDSGTDRKYALEIRI